MAVVLWGMANNNNNNNNTKWIGEGRGRRKGLNKDGRMAVVFIPSSAVVAVVVVVVLLSFDIQQRIGHARQQQAAHIHHTPHPGRRLSSIGG